MDFFINEIVENDRVKQKIRENMSMAGDARAIADKIIGGERVVPEKGLQTVFVLAHLADYALKINSQRGISKEITVATLKDVNVWFKNYEAVTGEIGIGEFDWLLYHYTGKIFRLGRLQFHIINGDGGRVINTHIPQDEPLIEDECVRSFDMARAFFKEIFPSEKPDRFVCSSWLLNENLDKILSEGSNIVRFMRLWTKEKEKDDDSAQAKKRVFGFDFDGNVETAPENTSLQRNLKAYLLSGGKVNKTEGYILV